MTPLRLLLADDHNLVRAGLRSLLERLPGVTVVAEASDGREALAAALRTRPDIVLLDITMVGLNGIDTALRLRRELPQARVLFLSMHTEPAIVREALSAGAAGYLLKGSTAAELELALDAVRKGDTYLSPAVARQVLTGALEAAGSSPPSVLTERQRDVLQLIAEGKTTKEIATLLGLSAKTVETHRAHLMDRLGIHDIAGLTRYAMRSGLITAER